MSKHRDSSRRRVLMSVCACLAAAGISGLAACESYDNGTTKSKTTKTVETPNEKTTTTTTHEKTVKPAP